MTDTRRYCLVNQLDIKQILFEAQSRWLRPAEICEILRNYKKFCIAPEPAKTPPSGSLFLFDRKVLRYFRKDGHNWRKKKDGKTVKEAHERLKAGSVDVLHCYYAHGEHNENFQRRSYWMLEEELSHIVLVHYREVKGNRTNFSRIKNSGEAIPSQETEENITTSGIDSSISSIFHSNNYQLPSQTTDTTSLTSAQASEYEDAESAYNYQPNSRFHPFLELQKQPGMEKIDSELPLPYDPISLSNNLQGRVSAFPGIEYLCVGRGEANNGRGLTYETRKDTDFTLWQDVPVNNTAGTQSPPFQQSFSPIGIDTTGIIPKQENEISGKLLRDGVGRKQEFEHHLQGHDDGQTSDGYSSHLSNWPADQKLQSYSACDVSKGLREPEVNQANLFDSFEPSHTYLKDQTVNPLQNELQMHLSNMEHGSIVRSDFESTLMMDEKSHYSYTLKHSLDDSLAEGGLKKFDSFNRWMSKELGDVSLLHQPTSSDAYWETVGSENAVNDAGVPSPLHLDTDILGPSISQDQLFSIIDFSPNWAYAGSETKVLITGKFLASPRSAEKCMWSCMFGKVEVPAEVVADGVLRCHAPLHKAGRVPFYVTCSNRLACSEVREFEYRLNNCQYENTSDAHREDCSDVLLHMRFVKLLSVVPECPANHVSEKSKLSGKISQLMKEDVSEWDRMLQLTSDKDFSTEKAKEQLLQQLLKEKLHVWLLQKEVEGGKGPNVLDQGGQGVLHFAAALGYDWAILPTIVAGMNVNFRDVNGWTALHWAAFCGRERTVATLLSLGAAPGALTDPTLKHPSGRTPADLAHTSSHKGIAGYLAESSLSAHLSSLDLKITSRNDALDISVIKAVQSVTEQNPTPLSDGGGLPHTLSMKDSLAAVRNATQAAARIHQVFRVQSFQKKQLKVYGDDKHGVSEERALSLIAVKSHKPGQHDGHAAAIRIQNKFRGWKGRKEFLIIRQRIVKIQAHVRGHQVRKNYRKIIWSVGIMEKIILRWRRKRSGFRGFKPDSAIERPSTQASTSSKGDDDDFLKEGRTQTEARLQKALARVKSMVQYPEARDQYRRLLNVVTEIKETKVVYEKLLNDSEGTGDYDNDLIDIEELIGDDDTFMFTQT